MIELGGQFDAAVRIVGKILDRAAHDLGVADHRQHVVRRVDRRREQPDRPHRAFDVAGDEVVAHFERSQHQDESAGGEVRQQSAPRSADRDTQRGDQRGERRRLDAEVAEDADDQHDVERHGDHVRDVTDHRRLDPLALERLGGERRDQPDQHPADDVDDDRARHLERSRDDDGFRRFVQVAEVHGLSVSAGGGRTCLRVAEHYRRTPPDARRARRTRTRCACHAIVTRGVSSALRPRTNRFAGPATRSHA